MDLYVTCILPEIGLNYYVGLYATYNGETTFVSIRSGDTEVCVQNPSMGYLSADVAVVR